MTTSSHFVQFFSANEYLVDSASDFARDSIDCGSTSVVIATAENHKAIEATLEQVGLQPSKLSAQYKYISLDAHRLLSTFMVDGEPDQQQFHLNLGLLIRQASARGQPVRIFGEVVAVLATMGHIDAAIRLEELWNELSREQDFTLFCGYAADAFRNDQRSRLRVCASARCMIA